MSDLTSTVSASPAAVASQEGHPAATWSDDIEDKLSKMTIQEPASLPRLPPEITLHILRYLRWKRDWSALARTCRRVSNVVSAELEKCCMGEYRDFSLWHACVADNHGLLLRHLSHDATIVNHTFTVYPTIFRDSPFGLGMSPLSAAVLVGRDDTVRLLLENNANPNLPDSEPGLYSNSLPYPINWAVRSKHKSSVAIISTLKQYSADMNQVPKDRGDGNFLDGYHHRSLKYAPIFEVLRLDMPVGNAYLKTATTNCKQFNHDFKKIQTLRLRQLKTLLLCGANPNAIGNSMTPIFFLLDRIAQYIPTFYFSNDLITSDEADEQASLVNDVALSLFDILLAHGADIHAFGITNFYKQQMGSRISHTYVESPLHAACRLKDRHRLLIDWFLFHNVDINIPTADGVTPLMVYCSSPFEDLERLRRFLDCGPLINLKDVLGLTALHYLCTNSFLKIGVKERAVRLMLNSGADPTALDHVNHYPLWRDETEDRSPDVHDSLYETLTCERKKWQKRKNKDENRRRHANHRCNERGGHEGRGPGKEENRDGDPECEQPGRRSENCSSVRGDHRGGHRGNRGSNRGRGGYRGQSQVGHHSSIQSGSGNTDDDHANGTQNSGFDESREEGHASQEQDRPALQRGSNQNVRGSSHRSSNRGAYRGGYRGNKRGRGGARRGGIQDNNTPRGPSS
ncbi:hypothetical protein F5Y03DRAFT_3790 [Xylaria venustula]|nr:hypothetical protein F5Y03DRAFT_3790 [Xylaria venustula]